MFNMCATLKQALVFILLNLCIFDKIASSQESSVCPKDTGFDFVIVGSGSAGSTVANRLSEISSINVVVLEAGEEPPLISYIPLSFTDTSRSPKSLRYQYFTVPQKNCCLAEKGSKAVVIQGKALGGSSNLNGMTYTRGNKQDFENWKNLGNPGWGYEDNLPYFLKLEDYHVPHSIEEDPYHHKGGPVCVSTPSYKTVATDTFLQAGQELGYFVTDPNAKNQTGITIEALIMKNNIRWSNYKAYLEPAMNRSNFKIWKNTLVTKILFNDSKAAIGVQFEYKGTNCTVNATKEVIISAGALNSPKLLLLSGIGPKDDLTKLKIPVLVDLPGVGQNLTDHVFLNGGIKAFVDEGTLPVQSRFTDPNSAEKLYLPTAFEAMAFIKTGLSEGDWPDFEIIQKGSWSLNLNIRFFQAFNPDNLSGEEIIKKATEEYKKSFKKTIFRGINESMISSLNESEINGYLKKLMLQINGALLLPKSRGSVTLNSSNPHDPPIIDPQYLSHPDDFQALVKGYNETIRLLMTNAYKRKGVQFFDFGKVAGCGSLFNPSKEYLECIVRKFTASGYHFVSSCMMAPKSSFGVVDTRLKVYELQNLRVIDSSVIPVPITGHTHISSIMVGERGADIIKQDWNFLTSNK